jgi:hypothetical protein
VLPPRDPALLASNSDNAYLPFPIQVPDRIALQRHMIRHGQGVVIQHIGNAADYDCSPNSTGPARPPARSRRRCCCFQPTRIIPKAKQGRTSTSSGIF